MRASDVMTTSVITVGPDTAVRDIAKTLSERRISAVPVLDADGNILGIVSEGDLIRRAETQTERHPSWWLSLLAAPEQRALDYIRSHGGAARDVMTRNVTTVGEEASLEEVADVLERNHIKRVPVTSKDRLVGIVSRADLLRGLATPKPVTEQNETDDATIRQRVEQALAETDVNRPFVTVIVSGGIAHLWGAVDSEPEKQALRVAAENTEGVKGIEDRIGVLSPMLRAAMWAE